MGDHTPLFPEAKLLEDLLHFRMTGNQENRTRLLILAAHIENTQQYTVSKSGSILAIALGDGNLFGRITEDDVSDLTSPSPCTTTSERVYIMVFSLTGR